MHLLIVPPLCKHLNYEPTKLWAIFFSFREPLESTLALALFASRMRLGRWARQHQLQSPHAASSSVRFWASYEPIPNHSKEQRNLSSHWQCFCNQTRCQSSSATFPSEYAFLFWQRVGPRAWTLFSWSAGRLRTCLIFRPWQGLLISWGASQQVV